MKIGTKRISIESGLNTGNIFSINLPKIKAQVIAGEFAAVNSCFKKAAVEDEKEKKL